jgi:hypothetical protein
MKKILGAVLLFFGSSVVHGICPQPAPKVCSAFFKSDAVFIGTVVSEHAVPDKDDPGFVEGWLYRVRVDRRFRGTTGQTAVVHTGNDSGRLLLEVGHQYLLFATFQNGHLQIGDDCGPLSDSSRMRGNVREIESLHGATAAIVEGEVRKETASGVGVRGVNVTVSGMGRTYRLTSDRQGLFRGLVPPGRYRIDVDSGAVLSDLSWIDPTDIEVVKGQCAQAQFIAR